MFHNTDDLGPETADPHSPDPAAAPPTSDDEDQQQESEHKKRNSGRTGPTSQAGRARSAQNARKHGATSTTLVLPSESEEGWLMVLKRWEEKYQPVEDSLKAQFVQYAAEAEWFRLRTIRYYDDFIRTTGGIPSFLYTPDQLQKHNLMLRYKRDADRAFHKEFRALEALHKSDKLDDAEKPVDPNDYPKPEIVLGTDEEIQAIIRAQRDPLRDDEYGEKPTEPANENSEAKPEPPPT
jgi:hypothetical protein